MLPFAGNRDVRCLGEPAAWPHTEVTPTWWAVKWPLFTTKTQLIYIFTYKTVLSCPTLIGSYQVTLCLIWPFPHSFPIFLLLFSLHQGQHDSIVSLCLGRGLSRTSRTPARHLLQQLKFLWNLGRNFMFSKLQLLLSSCWDFLFNISETLVQVCNQTFALY